MRYLVLVLLNLPVVLLALINLVTRYKTGRISRRKFQWQILLWTVVTLVIVSSFPIYNLIVSREPFESSKLSSFDIVQTTVIVFLIYTINTLRQKLEWTETRLRDLHQELSIMLSGKHGDKSSKR